MDWVQVCTLSAANDFQQLFCWKARPEKPFKN